MTAGQELSIAHHFAGLTDPRIDRSRLHELLDIIAIAICAVVAGADSWDDIEDFGHAKVAWLAEDRSAADLAAMRAIKHALDPAGLLNPGVLFED